MTSSDRFGRLRSLFDIYSARPACRLAVLAMLALAVALLVRGAASGSAIGAIPLAVLVWANHRRFLATVDALLSAHGWLILAIPLLVFGTRLALFPPTATDDLLRHIASAFWPDGYRGMYVETSLPPVDLYPGFDRAVGWLALQFGPLPAMWIVQAAAMSAFVAVMVAAARGAARDHPMSWVLVLAVLVVVLQVMSGRIFLGRPEIFMTIWALGALLVRSALGTIAWCTLGLVVGAGYWLAPVYFPAALVLMRPTRERAAAFVGLCAAWLLLWWHLSDGHLLEGLQWTVAQVGNRLPGLRVQENLDIVGVLLMPQMLVLAFASIWASRRDGADNRLLLLAAFFALSNQARYAGVIAPLLALHALPAVASLRLRWPANLRAAALALGAVAFSVIARDAPQLVDLPRFILPRGAVVLTRFSEATYSTPFTNPGAIRVAPAFEVGAARPPVQDLVLALGRGELDCRAVSDSAFTHLIEDRLRGAAPRCLMLVATQGRWRLWRIDR